jgi:hypothetical protein
MQSGGSGRKGIFKKLGRLFWVPSGSSALNMKKFSWIVLAAVIALGAGYGSVLAAVSFGEGYYTNLCGTGTRATKYTCDLGCEPTDGKCESQNNGAVKYVCSGNWEQCLENESGWGNLETLGDPGCGKTIQLSLFDKKCRREDGSWDGSCRLLGYMVWYSGVCRDLLTPMPTAKSVIIPTAVVKPVTSPTQNLTPTPTSVSKFRIPTPTVKPTNQPTITVVPTKAVMVCNRKCAVDSDCGAGFTCEDRVCRNPSCPTDKSCFCGQVAGTNSGKLVTPDTGWPVWFWAIIAAGVGYGGWRMSKWGRALWEV